MGKEKKVNKIVKYRELNKLSRIAQMLKEIVKLEENRPEMEKTAKENIKLLSTLALHSIADIENVVKYEEARKLTLVDELTGVHNFRYFKERLAEEFDRASRHGYDFCLLFLDVDGFKKINDTYGHPVGNSILSRCAQILKKNVRGIDIVFRYGGDEFAVLLPHTDLIGTQIVAKRIQKSISEYYQGKKRKLPGLSVSIGLAEFERKMKSAEILVNMADKALYMAKRRGRGSISFLNESNNAG